VLLFFVLAAYVCGLVLLMREILHVFVEQGNSPSLTYNTLLALVMVAAFAVHCARVLEVNNLRNAIIQKADFVDLRTLNFLTSFMMVAYGLSSFFLIIRSILVFKFFRVINIFQTVLYLALSNILHFSLFLGITIVLFALTGILLFGGQIEAFSSFTRAVLALLALLTRNLELTQFQQIAPVLGPLYFSIFYFTTYLILCRVVVAIFMRTMAELRRAKADAAQMELARFLWNKFQEWLWEEEEEEKKDPPCEVVTTKVTEMEAFVDALLRTVEASAATRQPPVTRAGPRGGGGGGGGDGGGNRDGGGEGSNSGHGSSGDSGLHKTDSSSSANGFSSVPPHERHNTPGKMDLQSSGRWAELSHNSDTFSPQQDIELRPLPARVQSPATSFPPPSPPATSLPPSSPPATSFPPPSPPVQLPSPRSQLSTSSPLASNKIHDSSAQSSTTSLAPLNNNNNNNNKALLEGLSILGLPSSPPSFPIPLIKNKKSVLPPLQNILSFNNKSESDRGSRYDPNLSGRSNHGILVHGCH